MSLRPARALLPALLLLALGLAACSPKKTLLPDVPPETGVFVQGQVDTVNHIAQLFWFGNDADGTVVGFELRFRNPAAPEDTAWIFTTRTDSIFTVYSPSGFTAPRFEVRAIDNAGQRDPSPAIADFSFTNQPAVVTITGSPGAADSVYATATIDWSTVDPDGVVGRVQYRVWLDGNEANARIVTGQRYSIPPSDFVEGGAVRAGQRFLVVQPIDDGGRVGTADTASFFVRDAQGARLLVIDDIPTSFAQNGPTDQLFYTAANNQTGVTWSLLQLQFNRPFRTVEDLEKTLSQFDVVVWYRGNQQPIATGQAYPLRDYQDALTTYVESGGRLLLEGGGLFVETNSQGIAGGALRPDMAPRLFGGSLIKREVPARDSTTSFGINNGRTLTTSVWSQVLRFTAIVSDVFCFQYGDTNQVAFWAPPLQLSNNNPERLAVGKSVPHAMGGRAVVMAFPVRVGNGGLPGSPTSPQEVLNKIYADLLGP